MKTRFTACAALVLSFLTSLSAVAEQADHWSFDSNGNTITDGEWTFTVSRRVAEAEVAEGTLGLWVLNCTQAPSSLSTLDFGKPIDDYGSSKYAFTNLGSYGSWLSSDQKLVVERVVLPTGVPFKIDQSFTGCTNLKDITPFLSDSCNSICRGAFQNCSAITNALVISGLGSSIADTWECFGGCSSIPSADLSQSSITALSRQFFYNCSSLEVVKLPATLDHLSASSSVGVFDGVTSLRRVEMHSSVDGFLNLFPSAATALSEIHFYNCLPNETNSVLKNISSSQQVTTYLHDMTDAQLVEWAKLTQGGELTGTSTWKSSIAGAKAYVNRPLVVYSVQHAQIAAGVDAVVLDGQNGTFTVSRGDDDPLVGDLVVNYETSGDAEEGTHYAALPGSVTIPNGQSSATVSVTGIYTGTEYAKGLTLTLTSGDYELVEGKTNASISITSGYRGVSVAKIKDANKELGQVGIFRVSRGDGDSTAGDLAVNLAYSGTAVNGTTYRALATSVTIPAGKAYEDFEIFPLHDSSVTSDSEAVITIASGAYSVLGGSATVQIVYGSGVWGCWRIINDGGQTKITDGTWTFKVSLQGSFVSTGDAYQMDVAAATDWPAEVSPLDFTKGFDYSYNNKTYKIGNWVMRMGSIADNGKVLTPTAAGEKVGELKLSGGAHTAMISDYTFTGCTNMVFDFATLPTNITSVGQYAFAGCGATGSVDAVNVLTIKSGAFRKCTGLTSITAPKVTAIGTYAFQDATGLVSANFGPDSECVLASIEGNAFYNCSSLKSFTPFLPSSCTTIGDNVFNGCSSLAIPLVYTGSAQFKEWSIFQDSGITSVDLSGSGVTNVNRACFAGCTSLTNVSFPACLRILEGGTAPFSGCTALEKVIFRSFVGLNVFGPYQGAYVYEGCTSLSEVHFYDCAPESTPANVYNGANSGIIVTYLHDMTDAQLTEWTQYTQGGELTQTSTWSSSIAGAKIYVNRPLVKYAEKQAQIAAGANAVVLDGQAGSFTVSRGEDEPLVGDRVVNYEVGGDAVAGTHYVALSGSVTIPHGESNATISVTGLYTGEAYTKDLTLTLTSGDYALVEGKTNATISIIGGYRSVSVAKIKDANKELGKVGYFRVSRGTGESTASALTVTLTYSGTAANGTTYRGVPTSVTIPAGQMYVDVEILPLDDASVTADSEATVTIAAGLYTVTGSPATVAIAYGNGVWGCWRFSSDGNAITDGTWTFKCSRKSDMVSTGDAYLLEIKQATTWPIAVSSLDFSKGFDNIYGNVTYKIGTWNTGFGAVSGNVPSPTAAGDVLGALTLSDGAHEAAINGNAFAGCTNMVFNLVNLPTNITSIGSWAFAGSSATGVLSSANLTTIGASAFRACCSITSLVAPKVTTIGEYAFYNATGIKSIDLGPDSECVLTSIGQYAFNGCSGLESFMPFLPSSLDTLDVREAFAYCSNLTNALVFTGSNLGETKDWASSSLFKGCTKIPSADFSGSTITAIRRAVFTDCTALQWIKLPSTFVEFGIPDDPTSLCNRSPFDQQTLGPNSVKLYIAATNLPVHTMNIPEITSIEFSTNLTTIADGAFASTGYSGLTNITFLTAKPAAIGADLFAGQKEGKITSYVRRKYLESWKTVADDGIIRLHSGTWTSGTTQFIRIDPKYAGFIVIAK